MGMQVECGVVEVSKKECDCSMYEGGSPVYMVGGIMLVNSSERTKR